MGDNIFARGGYCDEIKSLPESLFRHEIRPQRLLCGRLHFVRGAHRQKSSNVSRALEQRTSDRSLSQ